MKTPLHYASPDVRSGEPRTLLQVLLRLLLRAGALFFLALRLTVLACGYVLLAGGVAINLATLCAGRLFLMIGAVRWSRVSETTLSIANRIDRAVLAAIARLRKLTPRRAGASR